MTMKRNDGDLPGPLGGLAEERVTRARAIKLAGAMVGTGAFALLLPDEADALTRRQRRRRRLRRRRARQRRQNNVTSEQSTVNFGGTTVGTPVTESVDVTNNGTEPVTITPTVVGDGFTLADAGDITLQPGETVSVPVIFAPQVGAEAGDINTGELRLADAADGLLLEAVDLVGTVVNVLP